MANTLSPSQTGGTSSKRGRLLLIGGGVLVVALAGMMFVTRNIDWYAFSLPKMKANKEVTTDDELRIWK